MKIRTKLWLSFGTFVGILTVVIVAGYAGHTHMRGQVKEVIERDTRVIANSHQIMKLVVDMETGERGFVITGRDEYLEPYHNALNEFDELLAVQRDLLTDEPDQLARLKRIEALVTQWQDRTGRPEIQARRDLTNRESHESRLKSLVLSGMGRETFDQLRQATGPMLEAFEYDGNIVAARLVSQFEKAMLDQETGQRGYLLTGQEAFLEPFQAGGTQADESLENLQNIIDTAHDRKQTREDVVLLDKQFEEWLAAKQGGLDSLKIETEYNAMVDRLDQLAKRFEVARNDTLSIATANTLASLGAVATAHSRREQSEDAGTLEALQEEVNLFKQSLAKISTVNDRAYDISKMQQALDDLKAIAYRWRSESALPEIQSRRDMDASPETLSTLADKLAEGEGKTIMDAIRTEIDALLHIENENLDKRILATSQYVTTSTRVGIGLGVGALVLTCLFVMVFTRMIARPITELADGLDAISLGDRVRRIKVKTHDEVGQLAESFNKLSGQLLALEERQVLTDALSEAKEKAEAANLAKSAFLANMSHEIRTPLTAILGYGDILRDEQIDAERRIQAIDTINTAGKHLLAIINDVLDLSKIEAEKMVVEKIDTPLIGIVREVESLMRSRAVGKGVRFETAMTCAMPDRIMSDPTRLRQILMNLAGNAIKFTEIGEVSITLSTRQLDDNQRLVIEVKDTGIGLTPEQADRLFQAFGQANETVTRKHGGTGLGLTISRRLAGLMGGTVTLAHTKLGEGSCFEIDLPLEPAEEAKWVDQLDVVNPAGSVRKVEQEKPLSLTGRILLAEDGPDNQRLISFHLRKAGATVEIADNGRIALEMIEKSEEVGEPYDLLLTDMQMPEMDGYTLAGTLRGRGSKLPIVALTAHAMAEDRAKCEAAGCDDYASKPIDRALLIETCASWIGQQGGDSRMAKSA